MSNTTVMHTLADVVRRYDIIGIQEIKSLDAIQQLVLLANASAGASDTYSLVISSPLGRSTNKERYAYMYKSSKMTLMESHVWSTSW